MSAAKARVNMSSPKKEKKMKKKGEKLSDQRDK
jgi:hypothetical protein